MWKTVHRWVRSGLVGAAFVVFYCGGGVLGWSVLPLVWLLGPGPSEVRARRCRRWVSTTFRWFFDYMRWMGFFDYNPRSFDPPRPAPCFVLVANHPTLVDVIALLAAYPDATVLVKGKRYHNPLLGLLFRCCGFLDGGDGTAAGGIEVVERTCASVMSGCPVLIFPEGTRSSPGELLPFKRGAMRIARAAGVPLQPLFIRCDPPVLTKGRGWYSFPLNVVHYAIESMDPVRLADQKAGDRALMRGLRRTYEGRLKSSHGS